MKTYLTPQVFLLCSNCKDVITASNESLKFNNTSAGSDGENVLHWWAGR